VLANTRPTARKHVRAQHAAPLQPKT
jgi:hypothetical protein